MRVVSFYPHSENIFPVCVQRIEEVVIFVYNTAHKIIFTRKNLKHTFMATVTKKASKPVSKSKQKNKASTNASAPATENPQLPKPSQPYIVTVSNSSDK